MLRYWAWANRMPKIGSNMLIYLRRHTTRRQWHTHPRGKKCKLLAQRNTWAKMAKRRSRLKRAKNAFVSRYIFAVFSERGECGVRQKVESALELIANAFGLAFSWLTDICQISGSGGWMWKRKQTTPAQIHTQNWTKTGHKHFRDQTLRRHPYVSYTCRCQDRTQNFRFCVEVVEEYPHVICARDVVESRVPHCPTHCHGSLNWTCSIKRRRHTWLK